MPIGSSKMSPEHNTFFDEDLQKNTLKLLGNCKRAHVIAIAQQQLQNSPWMC
jgi:hypothetical protein